ncbi:Zn(II)2Cys6 transcription factor [Aspergillus clavatus NRRL 1]|uniref:C2H2 type zinc finger domain protein n=1 Tax=Aspergillus clavatus (strain ATCC 1007 / CBS 513.65 / DSM 816 / NCTC 3887 / NRRL 1 / QM 1276 / 107) TaxID=344612 RepID=A1C8T0_ASPCL|nr:C2H2 type zinc finger domain protein [Aspergillus clavatus NRRL 1]EAW13717.1 C2H2 type zinc finger domain protein [Aspergillus clavatus NRRL 1]
MRAIPCDGAYPSYPSISVIPIQHPIIPHSSLRWRHNPLCSCTMESESSQTQALFHCAHPGCHRSYRRKEHLNRHAASHRQVAPVGCPYCSSVFARNDTLRHHIRQRHKDKHVDHTRAVKACEYCRAQRSRCRGREKAPCEACVQRGISCSLAVVLVSSSGSASTSAPATPRHDGQSTQRAVHNSSSSETSPGDMRFSPRSLERGTVNVKPFVEAFFERFHPSWPFLHRATFDPAHEPPFLLQSVLMIGLWVMGDPKRQEAACALHEKLCLSIYQQKDKWEVTDLDSAKPTPWPMATYQGILLHIIFALLRQDPTHLNISFTYTLPRLPSQLLTTLVYTCLRQKMFFYPTILGQFIPGSVPDSFIWIGIEEIKRFALALYKVCRLCIVHDDTGHTTQMHGPPTVTGHARTLVSLEDLQFALPDSDDLWHASSDLAARLAEDGSMAYKNKNAEANWISQSVRLLRKNEVGFDWI